MRSNTRETPLYLLLFFASILIIFLDSKLLLNPLKSQVQKILTPLFTTLEATNLSRSIFSEDLKSKDLRIKQLEEENLNLLAKVAQDKALEEEILATRRLLGAQVPPSWKFEPARKLRALGDEIFLLSEVSPSQRTIVLVTKEEITKSGIYVGYTKDKVGDLTQVILPTHPESKLSAIIRKADSLEQRSSGILEGRGGRALLTQVVESDEIQDQDLVLVIPEGQSLSLQNELLVGRISKVSESQGLAFKQAEIELVITPRDLDFVFYLTKK